MRPGLFVSFGSATREIKNQQSTYGNPFHLDAILQATDQKLKER